MAIQSYKNSYVSYVAENIGTMFEHAVDSGLNYYIFWHTFVNSNVAKQIEKGNPKYLTCSSMDYFKELSFNIKIKQKFDINKDKYYWAGWILAQLQHETGHKFYKINEYLDINEVLKLYSTLHEADVKKFFAVAKDYFSKTKNVSNLKKIRSASGLTQKELAKRAEVELRSIQMYEQKRNDINKAQAETLYKLARVLGCNIEDLLEDN